MTQRLSTILILLSFSILRVSSQIYPISTVTTVTPPYPISLDGFVNQSASKINVQIHVNDATLNNYPVKLRLILKNNNVTIATSPAYLSQPIYLNGGDVVVLNAYDLTDLFRIENLDFTGYSKNQYINSGQLPDGIFQMSFEVIDYNRNFTISSSIPAFVYIYVNEPPILNLPFNQAQLEYASQQNIMFNWTFRHSPFSRPGLIPEYIFELWEVYPEYLDPYFVAQSTEPVYSETLLNTSLNYTIMNPLLISGRKYAWRVRVNDPEGITRFKSDGYSDIQWFKYGVNCTPPALEVDKVGAEHVTVTWETEQLQNNFTVRYRPKNQSTEEWYSINSEFLSKKIENLKSNTEYIVEVSGMCGSQESGYSDPITVRTDQSLDYQCGANAEIPEITNQDPLPVLLKGDYIKAGDFEVEVWSVEGSNGVFSGKGFVLVPLFNFLKLEADLNNIQVNTDYQLISGTIKTVYNLSNSLTVNLSDLFGDDDNTIDEGDPETNDFAQVADLKIDAGDSITSVVVNGNNVTVYTADGNVVTKPVSENQIVAVTAPSGEQYVVDGSTNTVYTQGSKNGMAPSGGSNGLAQASSSNIQYTVSFEPSEQQLYGLDLPGDKSPLNNYNSNTLGGTLQYIPWKSIEAGRFDKVVAVIEGTPADSVYFSRESTSMVMVAPTMDDSRKQLMITGDGHEDTDEMYAYYSVSESDSSSSSTEFYAGSLNLASYEKQQHNLCLVSVNGSAVPTEAAVMQNMNEVYKQAIVEWNVTRLSGGLTVTMPRTNQKMIDNTDLNDNLDYTPEMKLVNRAMKNHELYDRKTIYVFFFDDAVNTSISGFMPYKGQYAFIFGYTTGAEDDYQHTIAHEVGHGPFRLRHTFSNENPFKQNREETNNLMDYSGPNATVLHKYQWDLIHKPETMLFAWLEDEGEGESLLKEEASIHIDEFYYYNEDTAYLMRNDSTSIMNLYDKNGNLIEESEWTISGNKLSEKKDISLELTNSTTDNSGIEVKVNSGDLDLKIIICIVDIELQEISFSGDGYSSIRTGGYVISNDVESVDNEEYANDGNQPGTYQLYELFNPPHWDADNEKIKQSPLAYSKNSTIEISVKIEVKSDLKQKVYIRSTGTDEMNLESVEVELKENIGELQPTKLSKSLDDKLHKIDPFVLNWELSFDNRNWINIGQSENELFVLLGKSIKSTEYIILEFIYEKLGNSDIKNISSYENKAWDIFESKRIEYINTEGQTKILEYYGHPKIEGSKATTLLKNGDSQCRAWADLFCEMLISQGIPAKTKSVYSELNINEYIIVDNWHFEKNIDNMQPYDNINYSHINYVDTNDLFEGNLMPDQYGNYKWALNTIPEVVEEDGVEAQGDNNTNPISNFNFHEIVEANGKIYDPSYGKDYNSEDQLRKKAFAGYYVIEEDVQSLSGGVKARRVLFRKQIKLDEPEEGLIDNNAPKLKVMKVNNSAGATHINQGNGFFDTINGFLSDAEKTSTGAFVPINNDDDDVNGSMDKDQLLSVGSSETDLLPIQVEGVNSGYFKFIFPENIKLWKEPDRSGSVKSNRSYKVKDVNEYYYIEGHTVGDNLEVRIMTCLTEDYISIKDDKFKLTVFDWTGINTVANYSIHNYEVTGTLPGTARWIAPTGHQIVTNNSSLNIDVLWDNGAAVNHLGSVNFEVNPNYLWKKEINIIEISILSPSGGGDMFTCPLRNNSPRYYGTQSTSGRFDIINVASTLLQNSDFSNPNPQEHCIEVHVRIEITGPTRAGKTDAGKKDIEVGIVQNIRLENFLTTYPTVARSTLHRPTLMRYYLDLNEKNPDPPYYGDGVKFSGRNGSLTLEDAPTMGLPYKSDNMTGGTEIATSVDGTYHFFVFVTAINKEFKDTTQVLHDHYTVLGTGEWSFITSENNASINNYIHLSNGTLMNGHNSQILINQTNFMQIIDGRVPFVIIGPYFNYFGNGRFTFN